MLQNTTAFYYSLLTPFYGLHLIKHRTIGLMGGPYQTPNPNSHPNHNIIIIRTHSRQRTVALSILRDRQPLSRPLAQ